MFRGSKIGLVCDRKGCPRQLKPEWQDRMPEDPPDAVWFVTPCPWHLPDGCKDVGGDYYDKDNNWVDAI